MSKPIADFNELDCLRALVAGVYGVGSNGQLGGAGSGPSGGGPVVGIQETRTVTKNAATDANYTIPEGWLSYTIELNDSFDGTVNGIARTGAATPSISDCASPGNTVQAIAVTRSAGTYTITEGRRP